MDLTGRTGLASLRTGLFALLATTLLFGPSHAAETLQPGDRLALAVVGLGDLATEAVVAEDGTVRFPMAGAVPAAGKTLQAVETALRDALGGVVYEMHGVGGSSLVPIRPETVHLDIAAWRPVHVYGDVVAPGAQDFAPGASVRSALAQAGGMGVAGTTDPLTPLEAVGLIAEARKIEAAHAHQSRVVARLEALAEMAGGGPAAALPPGLAATQLDLARNRLGEERAFLEESLSLTDARLALLARQGEAQAEAVAADEAEAARAADLRERGLAANDRVLSARRAELLSATRLLDTEGEEAALTVRRADIARDLAVLSDAHRAEALAELETAAQRLRELEIDLAANRETLALASLTGLADAPEPVISAVIHRGRGPDKETIAADLDAPLRPGDIVEFRIEAPAAPPRPEG
ncbi:MAG: polysaccharide biosynthesis/export family protein [Pseudomonadota bacterium]